MNNIKQHIYTELKAITAITIGTLVGVVVYVLFLIGKIAIFGFNLGCIIAPIVAGYVEVFIARRICDESTGAISAFILFIITVLYGFIIKNPTFGFNLPTIGISLIIIQAAIPIAMNYFIIVVVIALLTYFLKIFKKIKKHTNHLFRKNNSKTIQKTEKEKIDINNQDILFLSTNNVDNLDIEEYLGFYEGRILIEKETNIVSENPDEDDAELLKLFQGSQDKALAILAENVKKDFGNGIIDLSIEFDLVGDLKNSSYQVCAKGTGVKLRKNS